MAVRSGASPQDSSTPSTRRPRITTCSTSSTLSSCAASTENSREVTPGRSRPVTVTSSVIWFVAMAVPNLPGSESVPGHTGGWGMDTSFRYIDGWVTAQHRARQAAGAVLRGGGQLGDKAGRIYGADAGDQVVAGAGPGPPDGEGPPGPRERHRVPPLGDVGDAGSVRRLEPVERRVDQPETMARVLVGDRDDAGELRGCFAGPPGRVPAGRGAREGVVDEHRAAERGAHRDVGDTAPVPGDAAHAVLVGGPGEEPGQPSAAGPRKRHRLL